MESPHTAGRMATLRRCPVFSDLPEPTIAFLAEIIRPQRFSAGETICAQGEPANEVFVIERGTLAVRKKGIAEPIGYMEEGELFGEYGMFGRGVRATTVVAETDVVLLLLDYDRFRKFLLGSPESTLALLEVAVRRFVHVDEF